jgi:hypothetical protein
MPDAGYESTLSDDDYKTYLAYREQRDEFGPIGDADNTDRETAAKIATFTDQPLALAVKYLQAKLAGK